jgi:AcrR family transcriptional regulator
MTSERAAGDAPTAVARSGRGRPTSAEAAALAERLRQAAYDVFLEHGYDRTTMEAVAAAAGITKRTLYARYSDKRALFLAVLTWALARHEHDSRLAEPLPDDLVEGLLVIARGALARAVDPDLVRLRRMAIAEAARFPDFAASSGALSWSPRLLAVLDLLRRHRGHLAIADGDLELAAEQFLALVAAIPTQLALFEASRSPADEERHLRFAVDLFLNGALKR